VVAADLEREIHVILDNLSTHKPNRDMWQAPQKLSFPRHANPRFLAQSDRNLVLDPDRAVAQRRASFVSVKDLIGHIDAFIAAYNQTAKPFLWTKVQGPPKTPQTVFRRLIIPGTS
jgi:hypothetical protein